MISLNIPEVKTFMSKLLMNSTFDMFLLKEMELQTYTCFTVNGQFNEDFFSKEELEQRENQQHLLWKDIRQTAYSMIKGNKSPLALKIVFQLPWEQCEQLVTESGDKLKADDIGGLYVNIRFEKKELRIITGAAIKTFTLDKTLEQEWDKRVKIMLKEDDIKYEEL